MVPMLVPLIDMFNHGGMQTRMLLSDPAEPQHNVRRDPIPHCMGTGWCYHFLASAQGQRHSGRMHLSSECGSRTI